MLPERGSDGTQDRTGETKEGPIENMNSYPDQIES